MASTVHRVAATALATCFGFVAAEGAFRAYHRLNPSFFFPDSSYNQFRGKPNGPDYQFTLNSRGFKDREFDDPKQPNRFRIVAIGDSLTFGAVPYPQHFLTVLEDRLNGGGASIELLNMGIPSTGPDQYRALLVNEALALQPDLVLCFLFVGNDFIEGDQRDRLAVSYVLSFVRNVYKAATGFEGRWIHGPAVYDDDRPTFTASRYLEIEVARSVVFDPERLPSLLDRTAGKLVSMLDVCRSRGISFAVVFIPDEMQIDGALQTEVRNAAQAGARLDFRLPNRLLGDALDRQRVDHFDLLDEFLAAASRSIRLYKPRDSHWNIAGNALAASVLERWLHDRLRHDAR